MKRILSPLLFAAALLMLLSSGRPVLAEPTAVCSPAHPISANDVELRVYGATWCSSCRATDAFFTSIGAVDTTPVTVGGRAVTVRLTHLDVDRLSPAERALMRGDGVPEIHLVVRDHVVFYQAGAITSRGDLDSFVDGGLQSGGCVLSAPRRR